MTHSWRDGSGSVYALNFALALMLAGVEDLSPAECIGNPSLAVKNSECQHRGKIWSAVWPTSRGLRLQLLLADSDKEPWFV